MAATRTLKHGHGKDRQTHSPASGTGNSLKNPQGISTRLSVWLKNDLRFSVERFPANVSLLPLWYRRAGDLDADAERLLLRPLISSNAVL